MSAVEVAVLTGDGAAEARALGRLLGQVSGSAPSLTPDRLSQVLRTPSTSVLVARLDGRIVGMALLLTLTTLSGDTGYVEEVVVDEAARGQHISTALMRELVRLAAEKGHRFVDLTSRPSRTAANGLYLSAGFELRETNCYRYRLDQPSPSGIGETSMPLQRNARNLRSLAGWFGRRSWLVSGGAAVCCRGSVGGGA